MRHSREWLLLGSSEQHFSHIMAKTSYISMMLNVLDQHVELDFYDTSMLERQSLHRDRLS